MSSDLFGVQTVPGAQPGIQVSSKNRSFLLENRVFRAQAGPAQQAGPTGRLSQARRLSRQAQQDQVFGKPSVQAHSRLLADRSASRQAQHMFSTRPSSPAGGPRGAERAAPSRQAERYAWAAERSRVRQRRRSDPVDRRQPTGARSTAAPRASGSPLESLTPILTFRSSMARGSTRTNSL